MQIVEKIDRIELEDDVSTLAPLLVTESSS
jgi:hypothetical protein